MLRSRRGSLTVALAVVVAVSLLAGSAWAAPLVLPTGVSSESNPPETSVDLGWHAGWGHTLYPDYSITPPAGATGFFYTVDRSPGTVMNVASAASYLSSTAATGTLMSTVLDIATTYNYPPLGGWVYSMPGMVDPREGVWYLHVLPYDGSGGAPVPLAQKDIPVGIDLTAPGKVTGVALAPDPSAPWSTSSVMSGTRVHVKWDGIDYDALSGGSYFTVWVDGLPAISGASTVGGADTKLKIAWWNSPIWFSSLWTAPYTATLEDLPPGKHVIQVSAADRAGNEGPKSDAAIVYTDPDTPSIVMTTPDTCGRYVTMSASVSDGGGVKYVDYYVDGRYAGRSGAWPFSLTVDMLPFGLGGHTVTGVVTDMAGRTASASKWMTALNFTVPHISRLRDTPDPFFPILRDGYKDDMIVTFRMAERAAVWLEVYSNADNSLVRRQWCGWRRGGSNRLKWDGMLDSGLKIAGDYHYRIVADDGQGNVTASSWGWTRVRAFLIQRLSRNRARVVYH